MGIEIWSFERYVYAKQQSANGTFRAEWLLIMNV